MFWFMINARPLEPCAQSGRAYVNCWINFALQDGAELLAKHYIRKAGWSPGEVEDVRHVERNDYLDDPALQYFEEAAKDGASLVFYEYPLDDAGEA